MLPISSRVEDAKPGRVAYLNRVAARAHAFRDRREIHPLVAIIIGYTDNTPPASFLNPHPKTIQGGLAMGAFMKEDDIYIGTFLDLFNIRFAPTPPLTFGGIVEMTALQKEFNIFRRGRPFSNSAKLLGLGGINNDVAKNRWLELLRNLPEKGDVAITNALVVNFKKRTPLPCFMRAHFSMPKTENRVIITESDTPLFYLDQQYLTISLPMSPRRQPATAKKKRG
jgi:hypothetical protein